MRVWRSRISELRDPSELSNHLGPLQTEYAFALHCTGIERWLVAAFTPLKPKHNFSYAMVEMCCNAIEQVVGADRHEVIGLSFSAVCVGSTLPLVFRRT